MATFDGSQIPSDMTTACYVVPEVTPGTAVKPAAANAVLHTGSARIKQPIVTLEDRQRYNSHSRRQVILARREAATWNLPCYLKLPSSLTVPAPSEADNLLYGLFGRRTVNAGVSRVFSPARTQDVMPRLSLWYYTAISVTRLTGACVDEGAFKVNASNSDDSVFGADFSGFGFEARTFYKCQLSVTIAPAGQVWTPVDISAVEPGLWFQVNDADVIDDNTGVGYLIDTVDYTAGTFHTTAGAALGHTAAATVILEPWKPAATEVGIPHHSSVGTASLAAVAIQPLEIGLTYKNNLKIPNEVMDSNEFPSLFIRAGRRMVEGTIRLYLMPRTGRYWRQHVANTSLALLAQINNRTGIDAWKLGLPAIKLLGPEIPDSDEELLIELPYSALATSALDDEMTLTQAGP